MKPLTQKILVIFLLLFLIGAVVWIFIQLPSNFSSGEGVNTSVLKLEDPLWGSFETKCLLGNGTEGIENALYLPWENRCITHVFCEYPNYTIEWYNQCGASR